MNYLRFFHLIAMMLTLEGPYLVKYIAESSVKIGSGIFFGNENPSIMRDSNHDSYPHSLPLAVLPILLTVNPTSCAGTEYAIIFTKGLYRIEFSLL